MPHGIYCHYERFYYLTWEDRAVFCHVFFLEFKSSSFLRVSRMHRCRDRVVQVMSVLPGVMLWYSNMLAAAMLMTSFSICAVIYIVLLVRDGKTVEPRVRDTCVGFYFGVNQCICFSTILACLISASNTQDFYLFSAYFMGIMWIAVPLAHGLGKLNCQFTVEVVDCIRSIGKNA